MESLFRSSISGKVQVPKIRISRIGIGLFCISSWYNTSWNSGVTDSALPCLTRLKVKIQNEIIQSHIHFVELVFCCIVQLALVRFPNYKKLCIQAFESAWKLIAQVCIDLRVGWQTVLVVGKVFHIWGPKIATSDRHL